MLEKSSCTQNHGSDVYSVGKKKRDLVSNKTGHKQSQNIRGYVMESMHCLRRTFCLAELFDELSGKGAFEIRHSFLYFFLLVRIFVHKFSSTCVW